MKRMLATITLAAVALWIGALPASAQGRSQGHGAGAPAGSMGETHEHGTNASSTVSGPRTPGELLNQNTQLSSRLGSLLPPGTDLQQAAAGFRNLGQFVAAVHVSHNLGISFDSLKCTELATATACPGMTVPSKKSSLGQAIHTLKPDLTSTETKSAAKQGEKEASGDIHSSGS